MFEATGPIQSELRSSQYLASLLDPNGNHRLGDLFLRRLIERALREVTGPSITPMDLDRMDFHGASLQRISPSASIQIVDPLSRLVWIIVSQVALAAYDDELQRNYEHASIRHSGWHIVGLFLASSGGKPTDPRHTLVSYRLVVESIETALQSRSPLTGGNIRSLVAQYVTMLKRHAMSDSELANLCRQIYRQHQHALDLIFEHCVLDGRKKESASSTPGASQGQ